MEEFVLESTAKTVSQPIHDAFEKLDSSRLRLDLAREAYEHCGVKDQRVETVLGQATQALLAAEDMRGTLQDRQSAAKDALAKAEALETAAGEGGPGAPSAVRVMVRNGITAEVSKKVVAQAMEARHLVQTAESEVRAFISSLKDRDAQHKGR